MKIVDVIVHFTNGVERICSGRYEGEEKRFLYSNVWGKFSEEQEKSYRKFNNPLPIAHPEPTHYIHKTVSIPVYARERINNG